MRDISRSNPGSGRPFSKGPDPRRGHGVKGRSGRKPHEFKQWCQEVLDRPQTRRAIERAVADPRTPGWVALLRFLASYAEGLPRQVVDIAAESGFDPARTGNARTELAARIDRVVARLAQQAAAGAST